MREIKFRAWDKRTERMFDNELLLKSGRELMKFVQRMRPYLPDMENAKGGLLLPTDDENMFFMQFTGLRDADGRDIYEGDVLEIVYENTDPDIVTVKYHGERGYPAFDTVPKLGCDENGLSYALAVCRVRVIGNIFEHPHLIEKEGNE